MTKISKEFLNSLIVFARETNTEADKWKAVGVDIVNSNLFEISAKLECAVIKEIFDSEYVDIWCDYVYPLVGTEFSKENPFIYEINKDSNEKIPVVWDDETFIDYMYEHLKD